MTEITGLILMAVLGIYYFCRKKTDRKKALFCKAAATSVPGILLLLHAAGISGSGVSEAGIYAPVIATLAAVIFYMAADVLLECRFTLGAFCFSIGHVCMTAGFCLNADRGFLFCGRADMEALLTAVLIFALFAAAAVMALHRYFRQLLQKKLFYPMLAYIIVLGIMTSASVTAGIRAGGATGIAAGAGGICFAVSDILLGRNRFGKKRSSVRGAAVLILYYLAVYLFAMRLWI